MVTNSLSFCLFGKVYLSFVSERQLCWVKYSWLADFLVLILWIYHPTLSWPASFLLRNLLVMAFCRFPLYVKKFFLLLLLKFSLSLILYSFIIMYLGENCLGLKFWDDLLASWIWTSRHLLRFGKFSVTVSFFLF